MNGLNKNVRSIVMVPISISTSLNVWHFFTSQHIVRGTYLPPYALPGLNMVELLRNSACRWVLFPSWDVLGSLPR